MNRTNKFLFLGLACFLFLWTSCDSGPRVIESDSDSEVSANTIPSLNESPKAAPANNNTNAVVSDEHKVVVEEALHTDKYSYLKVKENGESFWIAVSKRTVNTGDTYYYKGGLLKKNFYSKEFDRTFETVYLVSNVWRDPAEATGGEVTHTHTDGTTHTPADIPLADIRPAEGSIALSDLFANKDKYNGKTVKVTGKVMKVNPMIMQRNWLHLQDASGEKYDLAVTTMENVPLGAVISMEGTIAVDKDFGAGYRYDIIMEGAVLK